MPEVSIIIPIYKVEAYLARCLESVLAQTLASFEVICVNDGSPDGCAAILESYAQKDGRIRVHHQSNQGLATARNNGLALAQAPLILFLDSDDALHPRTLEITVALLHHHQADLVSFAHQEVQADQPLPADTIGDRAPTDLACQVTARPLYHYRKRQTFRIRASAWSKLYRRELIQEIPFIPGHLVEDMPHTLSVLARRPRSVLLQEKLYYYTVDNPGSISHLIITADRIQAYQSALDAVLDAFSQADRRDQRFVRRHIVGLYLRTQRRRLLRAPREKHLELYRALADQLRHLQQRDALRFWDLRLTEYLFYRRLMRLTDPAHARAATSFPSP